METRLQKMERHSELLNSVFANELLLDTILDYVIHDGGKVLISNARSSRLVCRNWQRSISRIMLNSHEPLFQFRLYDTVSICGKNRREKLLAEFQNLVVGKGHQNGRVPPYSIKAEFAYFEKNECQELLTVLKNCGTGLVELGVAFVDRFLCKPLHSNTFLPKLGLLRVTVLELSKKAATTLDKAELIQSIFKTSEQLKSFEFHVTTSVSALEFGKYNFSNLKIPSSITNMTFECALNESNLGALAKNHLPNLTNLKLCGYKHDGIISSILENVGKSLKVLSLEVLLAFSNDSWSRNASTFSFKLPLMEKLETLDLGNMYLMGQYSSLQQLVPMLKDLTLTPALLHDWAENSRLDSVVSLTVKWDSLGSRTNPIEAVLQARQIDALHNAFPNLEKLDIDMSEENYLECVKMIWRKLTSLKALTITIIGALRQVTSANVWDALLIGVPESSVNKLRRAPKLWEELQLTSDASVRNLTDLHTLQLQAYNVRKKPLISNAAFRFAFLRMPKLSTLFLGDHFVASKEMKKQWEKEGRTIDMEKVSEDDED